MTPEAIGGSPIRQAIASAASATGVEFGFLLSTAVRESSLNPRAEARTSSATGLFQFLDATWLTTVKRHGAKHGMAGEAAQIEIGADGRPQVADARVRRAILDMRYDPALSALMAAEFANDNADILRLRTGQEPQSGDLYAAHFLGAAGAAEMINAARDTPFMRADALFPEAARANRPIFYERDGSARSVAEVLDNLRRTAEREAPPVSAREMASARPSPRDLGMMDSWERAAWGVGDSVGIARVPGMDPELMSAGLLRAALGTPDGSRGGSAGLDPAMLAQLYGAADQMEDAAAIQAISAVLSTGSIAEALSPEPSSGRGGSGSGRDADSLGLRGRS